MAKNERPGQGRVGEIKNREQFKNPAIGNKYTERNTVNGQFTNNKSDPKPFKDVRREHSSSGTKGGQ